MSLIIKMDTIKTEEHLRKSIPYIMNERKTDGLCFSNAGITPEQILDTFFLTKQMHPTHGTRQGYHFKFSFSKDETIAPEDALSFVREWVEEYLGDHYVRWSSIFVTFTLKKIIDWNISFQTVSCIHLMNVDVYDCNSHIHNPACFHLTLDLFQTDSVA